MGVRQLCVREGSNARSFDRGRENLKHAAQVTVGEEQFRLLVESEGKAVLKASNNDQLELDWSAAQCKTTTPEGKQTTRIYVSADGVMGMRSGSGALLNAALLGGQHGDAKICT